MAIRTYKVTLDSKNTIAPEPVYLRQGDKTGAVVIDATLMDNGTPVSISGLTPSFMANTADGKAVVSDTTGFSIVDSSGGEFTYQVPSQLGAVDGKIKMAYFSFSDSSGTQSTFNVVFVVEKAVDMTQEHAKDWVSNLNEIIEQYNQWSNDAHSSWEQFVNENKEIIKSIDPGGKVLSELIGFRHSDMLSKTFDTAKLRGDFFDSDLRDRGVNVKWFGAVGDGVTDDGAAIMAAHQYANQYGFPVIYPYASYYISDTSKIPVKTSVDFCGSTIIVDEDTRTWESLYVLQNDIDDNSVDPSSVTISQDTEKVSQFSGNGICLYLVVNANKKDHIRYGENSDSGIDQQELLTADNEGNLMETPINDYSEVTQITEFPFNKKYIYFENAHFISKGSPAVDATKGMYYRNIVVHRNNSILKNITHEIETNSSSKQSQLGFIHILNCADITLKNIQLETHVFPTVDGVAAGDYDLYTNGVNDLKMFNVNSDMNMDNWGVMGGNMMKHVTVSNSKFSRFDTHISSYDISLENSEFNAITVSGGRSLFLNRVTVHDYSLVSLRNDYGSRWDGDILIKDCIIDSTEVSNLSGATAVIAGQPAFDHDYGFDSLVFGKKIKIENIVCYNATTSNTFRILNVAPTGSGSVSKKLYLAETIEVSNIKSSRPIKLFDGTNFNIFSSTKKHSISSTDSSQRVVDLVPNAEWEIKNIDFSQESYFNLDAHAYNSSLFVHTFDGDSSNDNTVVGTDCGIIPKIVFEDCIGLSLDFWGYCCACFVERSTISDAITDTATNGCRVKLSVTNSRYVPVENPDKIKNSLVTRFKMSSFSNTIFCAPVDINGNEISSPNIPEVYYSIFGGASASDISSNFGFYMETRTNACRWGTSVSLSFLDNYWPDFLLHGKGSILRAQSGFDPNIHMLNDSYYNYSTGKFRKYLPQGWTNIG